MLVLKQISTCDFAPKRGADVYTVQRIGETRERLPDGSLLCRDVPIARLGQMTYDQSELPVDPAKDGTITVHRDAETLFHPDTITSFEGVPITLNHPPGVMLNPANYQSFSRGTLTHLRRGEGEKKDMLVGDAIIRDERAIEAIEKRGWREVSPGYDADYEPIEGAPGHYKQRNIIGNHLALVMRGRGGAQCAVGDQLSPLLEGRMAFKKKSWGHKLLTALSTNDADGVEEAIREGSQEEPEGGSTTTDRRTRDNGERIEPTIAKPATDADPLAEIKEQIAALAAKIEAMVKPATDAEPTEPTEQSAADRMAEKMRAEGMSEDKIRECLAVCGLTPSDIARADESAGARATADEESAAVSEIEDEAERLDDTNRAPTGDAAFTTVFRDAIATAEVLNPGQKTPTMDAKGTAVTKRDAIHAIRCRALDAAMADADKAPIVKHFVGKRGTKAMTHDAVFNAFRAAGDAIRRANHAPRSQFSPPRIDNHAGAGVTAASINQRNREFFAKRQA
ncbi:hypothetical protein P792_00425 [Asaia sp. SF2.1]|nr:hypothetical protein P792_00425 [Asaia sp. SF2.1]